MDVGPSGEQSLLKARVAFREQFVRAPHLVAAGVGFRAGGAFDGSDCAKDGGPEWVYGPVHYAGWASVALADGARFGNGYWLE